MSMVLATTSNAGAPIAARRKIADDMTPRDWRGLLRGFMKFIAEEAEEPEHAEDATMPNGAGVMFLTPDGEALFIKRSSDGDHPGEWCLPGGSIEDGEDEVGAARRESKEEVGREPADLAQLDRRSTAGVDFVTFVEPVDEKFDPKLNDEHVDFMWAPVNAPPQPLHPGVEATLRADADEAMDALTEKQNAEGKLSGRQESEIGAVGSEKRDEMPADVFLEPASRKYPVKEKRDGEWKYSRKLLLAAARRARMNGNESLASRADGISAREFGDAKDSALDSALALALDRESAREIDRDGRLHVSKTNISKANVCPYLGKEIPGWDERTQTHALGLDPRKTYKLLRDPEELKLGAPTLNGVPLLRKHIPVSADDHKQWDTVGALGTTAEFNKPYLQDGLTIWVQQDIDGVNSGKKKELSAGYHYKPDMTPGEYEGEPYDGVMRDIEFNHVALVEDGRAGPDVVVADSTEELQWQALACALEDYFAHA